ncbi:GTP-binding protein Obg/CgtA [Hyphopichia burtonii NRRL Y-1933]|uniref:GTP-binding protein Obg/CgtA n=1 Tax=Hyphopichia burtonii NRRL Y-1933 TaxID=984485 RepID=A0A1E4RML6_9ASCO|nr:GTP-binding protein Obg/CgtA [Hyphopichia burtonii NRRL Y-1933]ODV68510.1 GTP-binding protein Obg/CgtA [Hyphopichia burtonii NRRL Y-1933]
MIRTGIKPPGLREITKIQLSLKDYFLGDEYRTHSIFTGVHADRMRNAQKVENKTFEDLRFIRLGSGKGGNGSVSFFRDSHTPFGPPDGGDGGDGGNIYIQVVEGLNSLHRLNKSYQAGYGESGKGSQLDGKNGRDIILEVPIGTTIRWIPDPVSIRRSIRRLKDRLDMVNLKMGLVNNEIQLYREDYQPGDGWIFKERDEEYQRERDYFNNLNERVKVYDEEIIFEERTNDRFPILGIDLNKPTLQPVLLLKGGKGGMGNMNFLTKDIRNPRFSKRGRNGIQEYFLLELKLIADLGLIGLPNAGKSTLLRSISKASPRVGHWEFTTLQPTIGTIQTTIDKEPFTVADIPGIIRGASQNKGMGLDFLRHIERTKGMVFVVSLELEDAVGDLQTLMQEVGDKRMQNKKKLVVATKADLNESSGNYHVLKDYVDSMSWKILPVCAKQDENIQKCIKLMSEMV